MFTFDIFTKLKYQRNRTYYYKWSQTPSGTLMEYNAPARTNYNVPEFPGLCIVGSAVVGPQTNSIYTLSEVSGGNALVRKYFENESISWSRIYYLNPAEVTLAVTSNENSLFFLDNFYLRILQFDTATGSLTNTIFYMLNIIGK